MALIMDGDGIQPTTTHGIAGVGDGIIPGAIAIGMIGDGMVAGIVLGTLAGILAGDGDGTITTGDTIMDGPITTAGMVIMVVIAEA